MTRRMQQWAAMTLTGLTALAWTPARATFPSTIPSAEAMKKLTPIIVVDAIEPCLPFWTDRLGFTLTNQVPEGDRIGFAMLEHGDVEVMYQTRSGIAADVPSVAESGAGTRSLLYIEVADVEDVARRLEGVEVAVPMRTTFYGAKELFVRAPCGTVVGFAQMGVE
ncbi:MAG: hypothetical protein OEY20_13750 [Gemmatimonadota bacterium]|nr:hypothetical protein [Gemmatimonadota bacterium]MDH4350429.1 hypothetical protein [Gemmatimonadota bacterium]MDH5198301.1 hypothetical protein [Gemmatimonadota bacterium]